MSTSEPDRIPRVHVVVTNGMQLELSVLTKEGELSSIAMSLSRINAQRLAHALLEYSGATPRKSTTEKEIHLMGTYQETFKKQYVVYYKDRR